VKVYRSGCHLSVSRIRCFEVGLSIAANARTKGSVASSWVLLKVKSLPNFCLGYMIALGVAMNSIIWLLILAPPCLALVLWQYVGIGARKRDILPWQYVRLGKYGFWVILAILYIVTFTAALVEHKL
jgi:hypothetical protein